MKIEEVKLNTLGMFTRKNFIEKCDYELWQKIAEFIDGEMAYVIEDSICDGQYAFIGLVDTEKDKELFYMIDQDSTIGMFIDDREGFNRAWDSGEYGHDEFFYLEPQHLIFEQQ